MEVLVSITISSFVALVAVGAFKALSDSSARLQAHCDAVAEVRYAADLLARDLGNLYRDSDKANTRLVAARGRTGEAEDPDLVFYTVSHTPARPGQPESDVCEVEYYLQRGGERSRLMRRQWPHPDKDAEQPGGVLAVVAEGIDVFDVRFSDGKKWYTEWSEQVDSLPSLVEVTVGLVSDQAPPWIQTFIVPTSRATGQGDLDTGAMDQADGSPEGPDGATGGRP